MEAEIKKTPGTARAKSTGPELTKEAVPQALPLLPKVGVEYKFPPKSPVPGCVFVQLRKKQIFPSSETTTEPMSEGYDLVGARFKVLQ